jgi:hypothetical protein
MKFSNNIRQHIIDTLLSSQPRVLLKLFYVPRYVGNKNKQSNSAHVVHFHVPSTNIGCIFVPNTVRLMLILYNSAEQ